MPPYFSAVIFETVAGPVVDDLVRDPFSGIAPRRTTDDGIPAKTNATIGGVAERITGGSVGKRAGGTDPQSGGAKGTRSGSGSGLTGSTNGPQSTTSQGSLSGPFGGSRSVGSAGGSGAAKAPSSISGRGLMTLADGTELFDSTSSPELAAFKAQEAADRQAAAQQGQSTAHQDSQRRRRRLS